MTESLKTHPDGPDYNKNLVGNSHSLSQILEDVRRRAQGGEAFFADRYFTNGMSESDQVDLIYGEFLMLLELGKEPDRQDYLTHFPQHREALERQFAFEECLGKENHISSETTLPYSLGDTWTEDSDVPQFIGKFVVVSRLGDGGQASVYRAVHPELKHEVVIKWSKTVLNKSSYDLIIAEGQTLAGLKHPALARVHDVGMHQGRPFLISEYVRGRTLDVYLREAKHSTEELAFMFSKIAEGLASAHRRGIIHLDIKPANIIIDEAGEPRLIDFGMSVTRDAFHEADWQRGMIRGTLGYMAPEQVPGDLDRIGTRTDIFNLGATLFFACTGEPPYSEQPLGEMLQQISDNQWQRELLHEHTECSALFPIILRSMDCDAEQRFQSCEELAASLKAVATRPRRVRQYCGTLLLACVVLMVCAIAYARTPGKSPEEGTQQGLLSSANDSFPIRINLDVVHEGRYLPFTERAPLHSGDKLRITSKIPAGHHASLFALNASGKVKLLQSYPASNYSSELRFPEGPSTAVPLTGPSGSEVLILCLRRKAPIIESDVERYEKSLGPPPAIPQMTVLAADQKRVFSIQSGRDFGAPEQVDSPEDAMTDYLEHLRQTIHADFDSLAAIAFHHAQ